MPTGILHLHLPKSKKAKPKQIEVKIVDRSTEVQKQGSEGRGPFFFDHHAPRSSDSLHPTRNDVTADALIW